jgi:hypothetical protein
MYMRSSCDPYRKTPCQALGIRDIDPRILELYVCDGVRPGRPIEIGEDVETGLIANLSKDRVGREKSSEVLAYEAGISVSSALKILRKNGCGIVKPTRKPGLTRAQRSVRLRWCLLHAKWTLKDLKRIT